MYLKAFCFDRLQWLKPAAALGFGFVLLAACGDSVTDPADITVFKLKTPMALTATPLSGTVSLSWFANNNEKDFTGFNVYLSSANRSDIVKEMSLVEDNFDPHLYSPVTFKNAKDEKIEGVRASLSKFFNWDIATKASKAGDGKTFGPFARCNVAANDKGGTCGAVTAANKNFRANGQISFTFPEGSLVNGQEYAVFVTSTKSDGKEIGSPTTGVMFVRPRASVKAVEDIEFKTDNNAPFMGLSFGFGGAPTKVTGSFTQSATQFCFAADDATKAAHVYFQSINNRAYIAGANGARIADLGPAVDSQNRLITGDLLSSNLRLDAQVLVPFAESAPSKETPASSDVGSEGGYTRCGQSRALMQSHLYAIAIPDGTEWRYALMAVPSDFAEEIVGSDNKRSTLSFVVGKNQNERRL